MESADLGRVVVPPKSLLFMAKRYFPLTIVDSMSPVCSGCVENRCGDEVLETHAKGLIEKWHKEIKMFDSREELYQNLIKYHDFPGSGYEFRSGPLFLESLREVQYISKTDAFKILKSMIQKMGSTRNLESFAKFIKEEEKRLNGRLEFVKWPLELKSMTCKDLEKVFFPKPKVVRLFDEHGKLFVMSEEMRRAGFRLDGDELDTIDSKIAVKMVLDERRTTEVDFVPFTITRTKHRAVPIQTPDGKLCKLATDVFFELMRDLIFGLKIFSGETKNHLRIKEFMGKLEKYFPAEKVYPYFITTDKIKEITDFALRYLASILPQPGPMSLNHGTEFLEIDEQLTLRRIFRNFPHFARFRLAEPVSGSSTEESPAFEVECSGRQDSQGVEASKNSLNMNESVLEQIEKRIDDAIITLQKTHQEELKQMKQAHEQQLNAARVNSENLMEENIEQKHIIKELQEQLEREKNEKMALREQLFACNRKTEDIKKMHKKLAESKEMLIRNHQRNCLTMENRHRKAVEALELINSNKDQQIRTLQDKLRQARNPKMQKTLTEFKNEMRRLESEDLMGEATKLGENLMSMTSNELIRKRARLELEIFRLQLQDYIGALQTNIEAIETKPQTTMSDLMQLPEMPTFSEHFYNDYEEALKDIEKIECLICLTEVPDRERAIECSCKKVFHLECLSKWRVIKPSCPNCRRQLH